MTRSNGSANYKAMLKGLGFNDAAVEYISDVDKGGFKDLKSLDVLMSGDPTGGKFVKSMRRPGGDSSNGVTVSFMAEMNFKSLLFYIRHNQRIDRAVVSTDIDVTSINKLTQQYDLEVEDKVNFKEPAPPKIDTSDWALSAENVLDYISKHRGVNGVKLSYVLRENLRVKAAVDDPAYGAADSVHASYDEEMISRASILSSNANANKMDEELEKDGPFTDTFLMDSAKVYDLLTGLFGEKEYFTYVKNAGKKSHVTNGRKGWQALFSHFVGPNMVDHITTTSESVLQNTKYMGETRKLNFEQYVTLQKKMHHRLANLERYGGRVVTEGEKLRYFKAGLVHNGLENIKIFISNDDACRVSFDKSVNAVKQFIQTELQPQPSALKVAAVEAGSNVTRLTADEVAECDLWRKTEEWNALPQSERSRIMRNRSTLKKERKQGVTAPARAKKAEQKLKDVKKKFTKQTKKVAKLERKIASLKRSKREDDESSGDESSEEEQTNANHPALTRGGPVKVKSEKEKKRKRSRKD